MTPGRQMVSYVGLIAAGFGFATADAALWGRLESTPGSGDFQAYYDDELNITWLADANFAKTTGYSDDYSADGSLPWAVANAWAAGLTIQGVSGWRLPAAGPVNGVAHNYNYAVNGTTDTGFNISAWRSVYSGSKANEMAHLFYNTLGNEGFRNLVGEVLYKGTSFIGGPFENVHSDYYWTVTESGVDPDSAAAFSFGGEQSWGSKNFYFRAWPVRTGDVEIGSDADGDGITDSQDNCPNTPNGPLLPDPEGGADQQDDDGDGIGNACDLLIATNSLPSATAGKSYSQQIIAVRGQSPYSWIIIGGSLPVGLSLSSTGVLSGNVQSTFTAFFTVQVMDATSDTAAQALSISVTLPGCYSCHAEITN
jgi:hypothetical protein